MKIHRYINFINESIDDDIRYIIDILQTYIDGSCEISHKDKALILSFMFDGEVDINEIESLNKRIQTAVGWTILSHEVLNGNIMFLLLDMETWSRLKKNGVKILSDLIFEEHFLNNLNGELNDKFKSNHKHAKFKCGGVTISVVSGSGLVNMWGDKYEIYDGSDAEKFMDDATANLHLIKIQSIILRKLFRGKHRH